MVMLVGESLFISLEGSAWIFVSSFFRGIVCFLTKALVRGLYWKLRLNGSMCVTMLRVPYFLIFRGKHTVWFKLLSIFSIKGSVSPFNFIVFISRLISLRGLIWGIGPGRGLALGFCFMTYWLYSQRVKPEAVRFIRIP